MLADDLPALSAGPEITDPPWQTRKQWQAVNAVLRYLIDRYAGRFDEVCEAAENLRYEFLALYPLLDRLCEVTCPGCRAPCCQVADPRFDLRDLIFIHFTEAALPVGQPRGGGFRICRYLGSSGCVLPRQSRPWICTWYICPTQTQLLSREFRPAYRQIQDFIQNIKYDRKQLEERWIELMRQ